MAEFPVDPMLSKNVTGSENYHDMHFTQIIHDNDKTSNTVELVNADTLDSK